MSKKPSQFLQDIIGKNVIVKLNSGLEYRGCNSDRSNVEIGTMACLDGFMNIALENSIEWVNGEQKNDYGECFIRGNNGNPYFTNS